MAKVLVDGIVHPVRPHQQVDQDVRQQRFVLFGRFGLEFVAEILQRLIGVAAQQHLEELDVGRIEVFEGRLPAVLELGIEL